MRARPWPIALAALAAIRVAIPLAALAAGGSALPGLPAYHRSSDLSGDATGFYETARDWMAAWGRVPQVLLAPLVLATIVAAVLLARAWRARPALRPWLVAGTAWWIGLLLVVNVFEERFSGAAVIGWPVVWALPMLPARLVGTLDPSVAFWLGLPLQLACNVVTVIATAYAGLYATGRRAVGLVAAAIFTVWPFLTGAIAGHAAWKNGTWPVDAGLHMYTEPLSTALCAVGLALLLSPRLSGLRIALAGCVLGYATAVKISNVVVAAAGALLLAWRFRSELRRAAPYLAAGLAWAPLVLAYWPLGYSKLTQDPKYWPRDPFRLSYLVTSWTHSILFTPRTLAIIAPVALVGGVALGRRWTTAVLGAWTLANPVLYSFYYYTPIHPRFLWASLPSFFVFWAAGAAAIVALASRLSPGSAPTEAPRLP